jgi:serine kinase of HPr protein (carbohydrate metabolism regulator)
MSETVHATAVLVGGDGVLIRGTSGAGKSALAVALLARGGRLIADDRITLSACHGRLVASAPGPIAGQIELRGRGPVNVPHERCAVLRLVIDIVSEQDLERMPEAPQLSVSLLGIVLPRQPVAGAAERCIPLIEAALVGPAPQPDSDLRSAQFSG